MKELHITNITYQDFNDDIYYITYPGIKSKLYGINIYGEVFSFVKNREKQLKGEITKGYIRYRLRTIDDQSKNFLISRLVAWEFVGQPENYIDLEVNHCDGVHLNNYYKNLEWCTKKENSIHKSIMDLAASSENHGWNSHSEKVVKDVIKKINKGWSAPNIALFILDKYPRLYNKTTKYDYDRIRGLVSKINNGTSWYKLKSKLESSTTIEHITYEKHIGEEVSRVGVHPIVVPNGRDIIFGNRI